MLHPINVEWEMVDQLTRLGNNKILSYAMISHDAYACLWERNLARPDVVPTNRPRSILGVVEM